MHPRRMEIVVAFRLSDQSNLSVDCCGPRKMATLFLDLWSFPSRLVEDRLMSLVWCLASSEESPWGEPYLLAVLEKFLNLLECSLRWTMTKLHRNIAVLIGFANQIAPKYF